MTKQRREFGLENFSLIDKDAGDQTTDLKVNQKNNTMPLTTRKKVLEIGLQAANKMKDLETQTYFSRLVNKCVQYDPNDFIKKMEEFSKADTHINEKLDKFIDRVAYRVEEALQSNEIINVFQDDFEMLGDDYAVGNSQINTVNNLPRTFFEQEYCKGKMVSCIKFHPKKPFLVALSLVQNWTFDKRAEQMGQSFDSYVLILNFSDNHIITLNYVLQTPIEITCIEFHPENPKVVVGGAINGQMVAWDLASAEHRITTGRQADTIAKMPDEEEDKTQQIAVKLRQLAMSSIDKSHKSYVSDIQFVPGTVRVDRKNPNNGESVHFVSCSEDGMVHIWDSRNVYLDEIKALEAKNKGLIWIPYLTISITK